MDCFPVVSTECWIKQHKKCKYAVLPGICLLALSLPLTPSPAPPRIVGTKSPERTFSRLPGQREALTSRKWEGGAKDRGSGMSPHLSLPLTDVSSRSSFSLLDLDRVEPLLPWPQFLLSGLYCGSCPFESSHPNVEVLVILPSPCVPPDSGWESMSVVASLC